MKTVVEALNSGGRFKAITAFNQVESSPDRTGAAQGNRQTIDVTSGAKSRG